MKTAVIGTRVARLRHSGITSVVVGVLTRKPNGVVET